MGIACRGEYPPLCVSRKKEFYHACSLVCSNVPFSRTRVWTAPVRDVLDNGDAFSQQRAFVKHQSRHVAQRVHLPVVAAWFDDLGMLVHLNGCKR